jgi:hypothetical protein
MLTVDTERSFGAVERINYHFPPLPTGDCVVIINEEEIWAGQTVRLLSFRMRSF